MVAKKSVGKKSDSLVDEAFLRGYYCAVGALLRERGEVTPSVKMLFGSGGSPEVADERDREIFREHGLMK